MSAGSGAVSRNAPPTGIEDLWELQDAGFPPTRMSSFQILSLISQGRVGLGSQVRRPPEQPWVPAASRAEFGYAFPYLNLPSERSERNKLPNAVVLVALYPSLVRALDVARQLAADPGARSIGSWYSGNLPSIPAPLVRRTRLFELWDGFWFAPLLPSAHVKPGDPVNVFLLAFNMTDHDQHRSLRTSGYDVAKEMQGNLTFSLPPWRWATQMVSIPTPGPPGEQTLGFRTRSGGERAATAAVVGVLTLGSFIYAPGSSGVSIRYEVLSSQSARSAETWEAFAIEAASKRFDDAHATAVSDRAGGRIPKQTLLQQFRTYVTPSLTYAALQDREHPAEQILSKALDEFLYDSFGYTTAEQAFLSD